MHNPYLKRAAPTLVAILTLGAAAWLLGACAAPPPKPGPELLLATLQERGAETDWVAIAYDELGDLMGHPIVAEDPLSTRTGSRRPWLNPATTGVAKSILKPLIESENVRAIYCDFRVMLTLNKTLRPSGYPTQVGGRPHWHFFVKVEPVGALAAEYDEVFYSESYVDDFMRE